MITGITRLPDRVPQSAHRWYGGREFVRYADPAVTLVIAETDGKFYAHGMPFTVGFVQRAKTEKSQTAPQQDGRVTATVTLTPQEQFFWDNAGYSWVTASETEESGHARAAVLLAHAETWLSSYHAHVEWRDDPETLLEENTPAYVAVLVRSDGTELAWLWGITFAPGEEPPAAPYARVVAAELALEHLGQNPQPY